MKNPYLVVPSYLTPSLLNDYKSLDWTGFSAVVCISGSVFRWTVNRSFVKQKNTVIVGTVLFSITKLILWLGFSNNN